MNTPLYLLHPKARKFFRQTQKDLDLSPDQLEQLRHICENYSQYRIELVFEWISKGFPPAGNKLAADEAALQALRREIVIDSWKEVYHTCRALKIGLPERPKKIT